MTRSVSALLCAIMLASIGCQTLGMRNPDPSVNARLDNARKLMDGHRYQEAVNDLEKFLQEDQNSSLAPQAKYLIATVYVTADNPEKDYAQALTEFDEFLHLYPTHELARNAKNWHTALKTIVETKKDNERLSKNIERLKQLDVRQEEKRLGR